MLYSDTSNTDFKLAANFVNHTSRHVFVTGKAGTGKTTFLKYIREHNPKNMVVTAPTGVAAINAGGVTLHALFQLPFGPFIPATLPGFQSNEGVTDSNSLFKHLRFGADKRVLLEELQLLIIDEVSMVRADMLDATDAILRHIRKKPQLPFGGVQVLYIGDLYQLPPVISPDEWDILKDYYESPFFFSAKALSAAPPLYIELKKIYRQKEQQFIDLLNRVRNNQLRKTDFDLLNERFRPGIEPGTDEKFITLTTHNRKADAINAAELEKLPGKKSLFKGVITGDFQEKSLPTELNLHIKEGAQVIFVKNDSGTDRQYFNGKLAIVKKINADEIIVSAEGRDLKLEKETWRNLRYIYDKGTGHIKEEELGSFTQYPVRLAWAITIHKSQGLTFEKAIIDAGAAFAPGQVYVALSRCTSLQGIILRSALHPAAVATDSRVVTFAQGASDLTALQQLLLEEQQAFSASQLLQTFNWQHIVQLMVRFRQLLPDKKLSYTGDAAMLAQRLYIAAAEQQAVADRFQQQLQQLLQQSQTNPAMDIIAERVDKGISWFVTAITKDLLQPLQAYLASLSAAAGMKKYAAAVSGIEEQLLQYIQRLIKASYGERALCKDPGKYEKYYIIPAPTAGKDAMARVKKKKGSSQAESLALFREGKTIAEIALLRTLSESTVTGHLCVFIQNGQLDIRELVPEEKLAMILPVVKEMNGTALSPIRELLGDACSYAEIKMVLHHWNWLQGNQYHA